MKGWERSLYCGQVQAAQAGKTVTLNGWVDRRRDLGGLIFVHLRDREGIVQVVFNPEKFPDAHRCAEEMRSEYVVAVRGEVRPRPAESVNDDLPTGAIEVLAHEAIILNDAKTPVFAIEDETDVAEDIRLTYRYLDLRRAPLQRNLRLRHRFYQATRRYLDGQGFVEVETPVLTKSTPEGARDYLVPSRVNPGEFFALPQSPQLFKQLLMVAGFDRYYPDRQVLPGRGPARRPAAGVHADRHRDVLRGSRRGPGDDGGAGRRALPRGAGDRAASTVPADHLRRGDPAVRAGRPGHALRPGAPGRRRRSSPGASSGRSPSPWRPAGGPWP